MSEFWNHRFYIGMGRAIAYVLLLSISSLLSAAPSPAPLINDVRLNRTISIDATGVPLDVLLQKLSSKDCVLSSGRSCAAWKLQIHLKKRPLHELMEALAQLLPGAWKPYSDKSGYELDMSLEAIARRDRWWQLFLGERDRALAAQRAYLLRLMRSEPYRRRPEDPNPENSDPRIEEGDAEQHDFFRSLPAFLQEQVAGNINDVAYYSLNDFSYGTGFLEGAVVVPLNILPASTQSWVFKRIVSRLPKGAQESALQNAVINFSNGGFVIVASIAFSDGRDRGFVAALGSDEPTCPQAIPLLLDQNALLKEVHRLGKAAPKAWIELAAYQESLFWKNDLPPNLPKNNPHRPRRPEILKWLADKAHMEFVADYYSLPGDRMSENEKSASLSHSLPKELDARAIEQDMSWKRTADSIYLFRDNRWYRDDYLEVPTPLLEKWMAERLHLEQQIDQQNNDNSESIVTERLRHWMDQTAEIVKNLTPWQITTGLRYFTPEQQTSQTETRDPESEKHNLALGLPPDYASPWQIHPFWHETTYFLHLYHTACFYAGLNDASRTAVLMNHLAFADLTPTQQAQALFLLPRLRVLLENHSEIPLLLGMRPTFSKKSLPRHPIAAALFIVDAQREDASDQSTPH